MGAMTAIGTMAVWQSVHVPGPCGSTLRYTRRGMKLRVVRLGWPLGWRMTSDLCGAYLGGYGPCCTRRIGE